MTDRLPPGIYPYLISPIDPEGRVDGEVLERLVDDLIEAKVNGLSPLGSTGEIMYLTAEQRGQVAEITVRAAAGRVPVVAGLAAFSTHDAIEQAKALEEVGVDGIVVMRQHAFATPEHCVINYFAEVAAAVSCPVVIYTNPALLGNDVSIEALRELATVDNISYVKDASGNTGRILSIRNQLGESLGVFSASAHVPLLVFLLGGVGWMGGPACAIPEAAVELYARYRAGDLDEALRLQGELWALNEVFQRYPLGACIKAALQLRGYEVGGPIPPQEPLGKAARDEIAAALRSAAAALEGAPTIAGRTGR